MINNSFRTKVVCPVCNKALSQNNNELNCSECDRIYQIKRGIPDFRNKNDYWCNVSREKMQHLNRTAIKTGDWLNSAREIIPEFANHLFPLYRADSQFLWPTDKNSRILDAGSMWGGITVPLSRQ